MVEDKGALAQMGVPDCRTLALKPSPVRFCASVNGIASAGLRSMDIACNFGYCYSGFIAFILDISGRKWDNYFTISFVQIGRIFDGNT